MRALKINRPIANRTMRPFFPSSQAAEAVAHIYAIDQDAPRALEHPTDARLATTAPSPLLDHPARNVRQALRSTTRPGSGNDPGDVEVVGGIALATTLITGGSLLPFAPFVGLPLIAASLPIMGYLIHRSNQRPDYRPRPSHLPEPTAENRAAILQSATEDYHRSGRHAATAPSLDDAQTELDRCLTVLREGKSTPLPALTPHPLAQYLAKKSAPWRLHCARANPQQRDELHEQLTAYRERIEDPIDEASAMKEGDYLNAMNTAMFLYRFGQAYQEGLAALRDEPYLQHPPTA